MGLLRGVYTEHIRFAQCELRECARNDQYVSTYFIRLLYFKNALEKEISLKERAVMAKVISFINYKGGVGKTTTTYHIGCALARFHQKKVLLIDTDPQTNLTFLCTIPERWKKFKREQGTVSNLFHAYLNNTLDTFDMNTILWKFPIRIGAHEVISLLELIPSDIELLGIDLDLAAKTTRRNETGFFHEQINLLRRSLNKIKSEFGIDTSRDARDARFYVEQRYILKKALDKIKDKYDYILIDCPPNLYLVTQNSLAASDYYIIATIPDHLSTIGINILIRKISELNNVLLQKYRIARLDAACVALKGILFTMVHKAGPHIVGMNKKIMQDIRDEYGDVCFEHYISWGIGYTEAAAQSTPVFLMNDDNAMRVAEQYKEVTKEFLEKVGGD